MREAIKNFGKQFKFEPVIKNQEKFKRSDKFIVAGMGGSHLAAGILKIWNPRLDLLIHRDYGLPRVPDYFLKESLIIVSSYSGNTEETIDVFEKALELGLNCAAVSIGGELLKIAASRGLPYIQMPDTGIQPRAALGFSFMAFLKLVSDESGLKQARDFSSSFNPNKYETKGKELAQKIQGKIPVIYSSAVNWALSYSWKIKFNETGKIPAFYNVFPELNHNEMTSFSAGGGSAFGGDIPMEARPLSDKFHFIFLKDPVDHPRVLKRLELTEKIYQSRGLPVTVIELFGKNFFEKIFGSLVLADWTSLYTAEHYGVEPEQVPMVEEFKKMMK